MEKLVASVDIQYKGKRFVPGEEISEYTQEMAEAWKRAGSVKVLTEEEKESPEGNSGTESGDGNPESGTGENTGSTSDDENGSEKSSGEVPDSKEPAKEGKKKK